MATAAVGRVESLVDGVADEVDAVVQLEFAQRVLDVVLHGAVGDLDIPHFRGGMSYEE